MNIKMSGSSGYLGGIITGELEKKGHHVEGINRDLLYSEVSQLAGKLKDSDIVIHLAGAPLLNRWTEKNKRIIIDSRVVTARNITQAINSLKPEDRPHKVISASGITVYSPGKKHTEQSTDYHSGFLGEVVKQWEQAWEELPDNVELTVFRMAAVLGKNSHAIKKMEFPFKMGVGGKVGNGKQPFPFVHETDLARAYVWAAENKQTAGIYILAAPHQINNAHFTKALANALNRPAFVKVPEFTLKLVYGQAATVITQSPAVYPEKLLSNGFSFKYETIEQTMEHIFQ